MGLDQNHVRFHSCGQRIPWKLSVASKRFLLVVPIELVGIFLAADLVGTVAKRLGVRQPAAANVFSFAAYGHWVWTAPRSFYDSSHGASVQHRQWDRKTRIRAWNSEVKQM